jgi:hypothetical protein
MNEINEVNEMDKLSAKLWSEKASSTEQVLLNESLANPAQLLKRMKFWRASITLFHYNEMMDATLKERRFKTSLRFTKDRRLVCYFTETRIAKVGVEIKEIAGVKIETAENRFPVISKRLAVSDAVIMLLEMIKVAEKMLMDNNCALKPTFTINNKPQNISFFVRFILTGIEVRDTGNQYLRAHPTIEQATETKESMTKKGADYKMERGAVSGRLKKQDNIDAYLNDETAAQKEEEIYQKVLAAAQLLKNKTPAERLAERKAMGSGLVKLTEEK